MDLQLLDEAPRGVLGVVMEADLLPEHRSEHTGSTSHGHAFSEQREAVKLHHVGEKLDDTRHNKIDGGHLNIVLHLLFVGLQECLHGVHKEESTQDGERSAAHQCCKEPGHKRPPLRPAKAQKPGHRHLVGLGDLLRATGLLLLGVLLLQSALALEQRRLPDPAVGADAPLHPRGLAGPLLGGLRLPGHLLGLGQGLVRASGLLHQLRVAAAFRDLALAQHVDDVRVPDRAQPVGDAHDGHAELGLGANVVDGVLDHLL
mmetsp:Transcript_28304/g.81482  ORF Transcript_28304/g.81482 Transcript_28304/m.81482 type:complete len:259 (+) Transcript_28304:604-1380(+)